MAVSTIDKKLTERLGVFQGTGTNHEGQKFDGRMQITPLLNGKGFSLHYVAHGQNGELFHEEKSTLAPDADGNWVLWNFNSNSPGIIAHTLRDEGPTGEGGYYWVFGVGDIHDMNSFREEIRLEVADNTSLRYDYSWGMPGGGFAERSAILLKPRRISSSSHTGADIADHIVHWRDIQFPDTAHYEGSEELFSIGSSFGKHFEFERLGIHHELLPPGRRTSWPHAESTEDEFVYVISGHPQAWIDGHIFDLEPGNAVGFPAGDGTAHAFMNNTDTDVHLIVVGDRTRADNQVYYPLHPDRREKIGGLWWENAPVRELGPHDGMPDQWREKVQASDGKLL